MFQRVELLVVVIIVFKRYPSTYCKVVVSFVATFKIWTLYLKIRMTTFKIILQYKAHYKLNIKRRCGAFGSASDSLSVSWAPLKAPVVSLSKQLYPPCKNCLLHNLTERNRYKLNIKVLFGQMYLQSKIKSQWLKLYCKKLFRDC